jgi:hypothetical protein
MTRRQAPQIFSTVRTAAASARTRRRRSASFISDTPYEGMISFSLGSQPEAVSSLAKHFSKTLIAINAAVDAPGEAPSSATSERSAAATSSVPRPPRLTSGLMVSRTVLSSDATKGLGFVPEFQPLRAWDDLERKRRGLA